MTTPRRPFYLFAALALVIASAFANAQPGNPLTPAQAEAKAKAEISRRYGLALSRLNPVYEELGKAFSERRARDPSQPTFEEAVTAAAQRRTAELFAQIGTAVGQRRDDLVAFRTALEGSRQGPSMSARTDAEQQEFVAGLGTGIFAASDALNSGILVVGELYCDVARDLSLQIYPPGENANPLRVQIESARELLSYNVVQARREIAEGERVFREKLPEITERMREEGGFRDDRTTEPLVFGTPPNQLVINPDPGSPSIDTFMRTPNGPDDFEGSVLTPREGGGFSQRARDAGIAFLRMNYPGQQGEDFIRRFNREIDRINDLEARREAARRRCLTGGGGGGGLKHAATSKLLAPCDNLQLTVWDDFLDAGGTLTVAELLDIYAGYDPFDPFTTAGAHSGRSLSAAGTSVSSVGWTPSSAGTSPSSVGWSLSAAGTSFSSVGWSLSAAGTSLSSVGWTPDWGWGGGMSLAGSPTMSLAGGPLGAGYPFNTVVTMNQPWNGLYQNAGYRAGGGYQVIRDPFGRLGEFSPEARLAGFTHGLTRDEILRILRLQGIGGLDRLLAQPFNVLLTWGAGAFDVDLHMTGPSGNNDNSRFHIFYAATGSQTAFPFAQLIRDCICASGSEVILTTRLLQGGVYRISAFNFGNQSPTSTQLSTNADLQLLIVRGGAAVSVGNGTTIQGGTVVFSGRPSPGQAGNTWVGVEIDPRTGQIRFVNRSDNSVNGDGTAATAVQAAARSIAPAGISSPRVDPRAPLQ